MNWFLEWSGEQLNSNNEMTDRDFKLLVIEERRLRAMNPSIDLEPKLHKKFQEVKKLLEKELEDFTRRDVEELPFKETEI